MTATAAERARERARNGHTPPAESAPQDSSTSEPQPERWLRGAAILDYMLARATEPFVPLTLGGEELIKIRTGGTATMTGGTGSGKTSLDFCIATEHAHQRGPAIAVTLEMPIDEAGGRAGGIQADESWFGMLTGRRSRDELVGYYPDRLCMIDRRHGSLATVRAAIAAMRADYPGEPILVTLDYIQIMQSDEREIRRRVAESMAAIDELARSERVVVLALSQSSRAASNQLRSGERVGADTTDTAAEAAEVERWSTATIAIGGHQPTEDGDSCLVSISIGKMRMGVGDQVRMARYCGRSGKWRLEGESRPAAEVKAERKTARADADLTTTKLAIGAAAAKAKQPCTHTELIQAAGIRSRQVGLQAIRALLASPEDELVEVRCKKARAPSWKVWTRSRAEAAGIGIIESEAP